MKPILDGLTFDDVLLVPRHSKIKSRSEVNLTTNIGLMELELPIISANMKTVTGPKMAREMNNCGGLGILHRFWSDDKKENAKFMFDHYDQNCTHFSTTPAQIGVSVGLDDNDFWEEYCTRYSAVNDWESGFFPKVICVDIAHADNDHCLKWVYELRKRIDQLKAKPVLMVGNVSTGDGAWNVYNAGADCVKVGQGSGCFAAGTRILMSNGFYKNIEDIEPGDRVINMYGKSVTVKAKIKTGIKRVNKIKISTYHKLVYVTPEHKFWVGDLSTIKESTLKSYGYKKALSKNHRNSLSKIKWMEIGDERKKSTLFPRFINFEMPKTFEISIKKRCFGNGKDPSVGRLTDVILKPSYELGYLFGTFLGDGHAMIATTNDGKSNIDHVKWYFGKNEEKFAKQTCDCIDFLFGENTAKIVHTNNTIDVVWYYKPFADFLQSFGEKKNKKLPEQYLVCHNDYIMGLMNGLIDSDGHIENTGRKRLTNTSEYIIELYSICSYIINGAMPNAQFKQPSTGNLIFKNIENFNDGYISENIVTEKKRLLDNFQVSKILENKDTGIELEVYDIEVDCETHSFIAGNCIVHNSLCSTRIETGNGVPQLTALMEVKDRLDDKISIVSDGGIRTAGDIVKALCFADAVMVGNLLAGTDCAPGDIITIHGRQYKTYVGSSTHKTNHIEGVRGLVPIDIPTAEKLRILSEGIESGLSYQGVDNLKDLQKVAQFVRISNSGLIESKPHDVFGL